MTGMAGKQPEYRNEIRHRIQWTGASSITFHVSGENTPFDHVNYVPGQSPGRQPVHLPSFMNHYSPPLYMYAGQMRTLPPGIVDDVQSVHCS